VGIAAAAAVRRHPWQLERETNVNWLLYEDWRTAAYNAITLGLGFASRIGFWVFFLVPLGAFVAGDIRAGLLIYTTYAATRTLGSFIVAAISFRSKAFVRTIQRWHGHVRIVADAAFFAGIGYALGRFPTT
jgi:hypothetical protein